MWVAKKVIEERNDGIHEVVSKGSKKTAPVAPDATRKSFALFSNVFMEEEDHEDIAEHVKGDKPEADVEEHSVEDNVQEGEPHDLHG